MRPVDRQIARVIAPAFLLFIRAVVLFIDNNHAEIFKGREQRRARADDNRRLAAFGFQPGRQPFAVVERGVQHFDGRVETLAKAGDGLGRQADFRHQHQRLFALRERIFEHA